MQDWERGRMCSWGRRGKSETVGGRKVCGSKGEGVFAAENTCHCTL